MRHLLMTSNKEKTNNKEVSRYVDIIIYHQVI